MSKIYTSADQLIGHTPLLELTHYNLPHFWSNCKSLPPKLCEIFSENIRHLFNNVLEIPG